MSPHDRQLFAVLQAEWTSEERRPSNHDYAMLEEISFIRREAQAEADLAYECWRQRPGADAYVVYRAAQDRADAAQDDLADLVQRLAA